MFDRLAIINDETSASVAVPLYVGIELQIGEPIDIERAITPARRCIQSDDSIMGACFDRCINQSTDEMLFADRVVDREHRTWKRSVNLQRMQIVDGYICTCV